ncbi:hypothetical protein, partial [uncultured Methanobrevibacter sp.]|uniref:beta strand repeat-containing protein n=1 Tax=uncultured Methanobrevibacter sp. TaxID=253161 RepID=UPI0025FA3D3E
MVSCVSAQDTSDLISDSSGDVSTTDSAVLQLSANDNVLAAGEGTFTDLAGNISGKTSLTLDKDYVYNTTGDTAYVNGIEINGPLTINGGGHYISGNDAARIFNVASGTLTLDNVTVCDGAAGAGAGVYVASGASLIASDVIFEDNVALDNGGAVYTDGGEISLTGCVLDANDVANLESSAFDNKGGAAIYAKDAQLTLVNTNVTNNGRSDLDRRNGDMINAVINLIDSSADITGGLFENNTGIYGGAIYAEGDGSQTLTISGATFNNNKGYNGGAIDISNMVTTISDCEFNDNWVIGPGSKNYYALGGAVAADGNGSFTLTGSNFTGNHADGVNGSAGAVSVGLDEHSTALIDDCEFKDNTAAFKAGAVFIAGYNGDATISNSKFSGNDAEMGDAIYNGGFLALAGNTIEGNGADIYTNDPITTQAWVIVNDNTTIDVEYYDTIPIVVKITDDMGNFIRINETTLEIDLGDRWTRVALTLDEATGFYTTDAYLVDQKSGLLTPSRITLGKYISGYTAAKNLNSTYINMVKANPILNVTYENITYPGDVVITVNLTGKAGAPKINWAATAATPFMVTVNDVVYKVKITNGIGTVTVPDLPVGEYVINASWGGNTKYNGVGPQYYDLTVTYLKGTYTDLQNRIDAAIAAGESLVLPYDFAYNESYDGANFINGVVINNDIGIDGKGYNISGNNTARIFNVGNGFVLTLTNVTLTEGYNDVEGGAVLVSAGAEFDADYVTFTDNAARFGGAISNYGTIDIDHSVFNGNDNTQRNFAGGSAIYNENIATINNTLFENNLKVKANRSNGDFIWGAVSSMNGKLEVYNSNFTNNSGTHGGAISTWSENDVESSALFDNCRFEDNTGYNGGVIYSFKSKLDVKNSYFENNVAEGTGSTGATSAGGAILVIEAAQPAYIYNSKFKDNKVVNGALPNGGAISIDNSVVTVELSTFESNEANMGGAIASDADSSLFVTRSNFTDNDATNGSAIYSNGLLTLLGNNISTTVAEIVSGSKGKVISDVYVTVLGNKTIPAYIGDEVVLNATVTDDMGNLIEDSKFN